MSPPDAPRFPFESCPAAHESPEALLSWPPMVRYLDACISRAVKPWAAALGPDDFAEVRTRAYVALSLDPELRGLLRRLAVELGRYQKSASASARAAAGSGVK